MLPTRSPAPEDLPRRFAEERALEAYEDVEASGSSQSCSESWGCLGVRGLVWQWKRRVYNAFWCVGEILLVLTGNKGI